MRFIKMQGTGNDYLFVDQTEGEIQDPEGAAVSLTHPHFGVGSDGLVLYGQGREADAYMRIFNKDGSEGKTCGNALRCVAKLWFEAGRVEGERFTVDTASGIRGVCCHTVGKKVTSVTVSMGKPIFSVDAIPMCAVRDPALSYPVYLEGKCYFLTCLSMGNPHAVLFLEEIDGIDVKKTGEAIATSGLFPEGVNVEFCKILPGGLKCRVYERGSGETLSCGSGACAAAAALFCKREYESLKRVSVEMPGGTLFVAREEGEYYLTGGCEEVFRGELDLTKISEGARG